MATNTTTSLVNPDKEFASGLERTVDGFIRFPRDIELRRSLFDPDSFKHPAKANIHLIRAIVEFVSQEGETIMDVMAGTGTLMMATLSGRKVVLIEDAPIFFSYIMNSQARFVEEQGVDTGAITLLHGDCESYLPLPCDHIIFSPPYSSTIKFKATADSTKFLGGSTYIDGDLDVFEDYLGTDKNFGRLKPFQYNQRMLNVYRLCLQSIRPGGTLTIIIQDMMKGGKREPLSEWAMSSCLRMGFELSDWFKRYSPGTGYKQERRKKGYKVIENEDIIILRKPE